MIVDFIDDHRSEHGVEPISAALQGTSAQIAPSTYYAAKSRPPSARSVRDARLTAQIQQVHTSNYGVYGARKVHAELNRVGPVDNRPVARCTVGRLTRADGLRGVRRTKTPRTTLPGPETDRPADFVDRQLVALAPNQLWVADITHRTTGDSRTIPTHPELVAIPRSRDTYGPTIRIDPDPAEIRRISWESISPGQKPFTRVAGVGFEPT